MLWPKDMDMGPTRALLLRLCFCLLRKLRQGPHPSNLKDYSIEA